MAHHLLVLGEREVVLGERDAEDDGGDLLEAVDPLAALGPLPANVNEPEVQALVCERGLHNARRLHARPQHVVHRRHVACTLTQ